MDLFLTTILVVGMVQMLLPLAQGVECLIRQPESLKFVFRLPFWQNLHHYFGCVGCVVYQRVFTPNVNRSYDRWGGELNGERK